MSKETLKEMLIRHEAVRFFPYRDSVGKITIGVGRNLDDVGINKEEAMYMLKNDIDRAIADSVTWLGEDVFYTINDARKMVVVNMMFNMGLPTMEGFKKFKEALRGYNYVQASYEMADSKWYGQVGARGRELRQIMADGVTLR